MYLKKTRTAQKTFVPVFQICCGFLLLRPKAEAFLGYSCEPAGWKQSLVLCPNGFHGAHAGLSGSLPPTQVSPALFTPCGSGLFSGSGAAGLVPSCSLPVTCLAFWGGKQDEGTTE